MNPYGKFCAERKQKIEALGTDGNLQHFSRQWMDRAQEKRYSYHFEWMGRPIIQYPQDMIAMQEIIWEVKPELIIETGIAHGGSLIYYASLLELIGRGEVIGVDIEIRAHNRASIEAHPMFKRIKLLEGSSIVPDIVGQIRKTAEGKRVLVVLDSNHTHDHVLAELEAYAPLVAVGSYCVVMDTVVEDMPDDFFPDRPWGKGNNPKTAVREFLRNNDRFEIDKEVENKLLITVAPGGYLKCVKD